MNPGSDQVNRVRKAKRMVKPFMLRDPTPHHNHRLCIECGVNQRMGGSWRICHDCWIDDPT